VAGRTGIPSEAEIAADLKVSPGTVRKALDEMAAERLLVRRQGRGTTVSRHDDDRVMFQFFKLMPDEGERRFPESRSLSVATRPAAEEARAALGLTAGALVLRLERLRSLSGETCILEEVQLPAALFPGAGGTRAAEQSLPALRGRVRHHGRPGERAPQGRRGNESAGTPPEAPGGEPSPADRAHGLRP
jgi:DNA-binding GntR family transcriptional regulator